MIVVLGATLTGMAAAARLARVGHRVVILDQAEGPHDLLPSPVDADDTTVTLPAAWRDLFRKSGRPLDAELARHRLSLTPAPPAVHQLPGGDELLLPSDRAGQWHSLVDTLGAGVATTWRDLLDRLDTSWLALRPLGVEAELVTTRLDRATRQALRPQESLADLARLAGPELGGLFTGLALRRDSDPRQAPGWLGTRLSIERTFGRWQLTDPDGVPQPTARLADLLVQRIADRGVSVRWSTRAERVAPGLVNTSDGSLACRAVVVTLDPWQHRDLVGRADREWAAPLRRLHPAATGGPRWEGWQTILRLPRLRTGLPGVYHASAFSPAGPEPWAQLLTGALAAYRVHEDLTGQDMRPPNKLWRPGQARTHSLDEASLPDAVGRSS